MAGWGTINWNDILENVGFFWVYNFGLLLSWNIASEWNEGIKLFPPLCYNLVPIYPTPKEEAFQMRDIGYLFINWQFIVTFSSSFKQKGQFYTIRRSWKSFWFRFDQFTSKILYILTHFYCYSNSSHLPFP